MCELISAPNIITFLPNPLLSDNEKLPRASNQIPYPGYSFFFKISSVRSQFRGPKQRIS